jgi:extensin-like protein
LSEHGRANALDIGAFVIARGQVALVVADWGPTARETAEQAAAQAEAEKARADAPPTRGAESQETGAGPGQSAAQPITASTPGGASAATISIPGLSINIPGLPSARPSELGLTQPNRLGGPKPASPAQVAPTPTAAHGKTEFLRAAHRTACKAFGTVLGPEANRAHKNHFHVDMAERKATAICE